MDLDAEKQKLIDARAYIAAWEDNPITRDLLQDNKEQQETAIRLICESEVHDLGSLCALLVAQGHLRGLRRFMSLVQENKESVEEQIKELNEQN